MYKTKFLTGDVNWLQYGGKFITKKFNNGEFDYWIVLDFINFEDATGEKMNGSKYVLQVLSVSPHQAGSENLKKAFDCCGMEFSTDPLIQVEVLTSYGVYAVLDSFDGNNAYKLLKEAKHQIPVYTGLYGFYMDRKVNAIGNNNWDFIAGNIGFKS